MKLKILLLYLINLSYEYLIIPFKSSLSNIEDNLLPNQFMNKILYNDMTTNIKLGNPYQNLSFCLDFNSYFSYVLNPDLPQINSKEKYYKNKSSSYKEYSNESIVFGASSFEKGYNTSDIMKLNDETKEITLNFILVTNNNKKTNLNCSGSFGLGNDDIIKDFKEGNLIYLFKQNKLAENYIFTLIFNKNDNDGRVIFGKNIYENYSDNLYHSALLIPSIGHQFFWGWSYFTIYFNNFLTNLKTVYIRPDIGVIIMNYNLKNEIQSRFFSWLIIHKKCYENHFNHYYYFYCDEDVNLEFASLNFKRATNNVTFTLDYNDIIKVYNGKKYLLILFDTILPHGNIYVGLPLLKKYDFIFDKDKNTMGFYDFKIDYKDDDDKDDKIKDKEKKDDKKTYPKKENITNNKFYSLFFVMFLILVLFYSIFIFHRKNRRKNNMFNLKEFEYDKF